MTGGSRRPFYAEYAWAFDLFIDRPVRKECKTLAAWLVERGVLPGSELLDAGCGTGRYVTELARRGYVVHGIDLSVELIDVARRSIERGAAVRFLCSRQHHGTTGWPLRCHSLPRGAQRHR